MPRKPSLRQKLQYKFENTLSAGSIAIIMWLAIISFITVILAAVVMIIAGIGGNPETGENVSFIEAAWGSLMHALDAGNLAGDSGWALRIVMLVVTIVGIFIVSSLIGAITSGLDSRIEEMRKGRSKVLEENHTLILGWSPKIFTIINELIIANQQKNRPRIVILADKDKVEMEDEIKARFPDTGNTKIICRSGSPLDLSDLEVAAPHDARSIIIVSPDEVSGPDTYVIKSILAITNNPNRRSKPYHIVAELREEKNLEAAQLVGNKEAVLVLSSDLIARVTAQTCRQSGLSVVYTELLDFEGAEIYMREEPGLNGKTYATALHAYPNASVIGIYRKNDELLLNPAMTTELEAGDLLVYIAEDSASAVLSSPPGKVNNEALQPRTPQPAGTERTLVLGWNEKAPSIIRELDTYVAEGSEVMVVCTGHEAEHAAAQLAPELVHLRLRYRNADSTQRAVLDSLKVDSYNHIILLCNSHIDVQEADAQVLISLLHLRSMASQFNRDFSIVSEMRDIRNRALADVARADDFIVSDKLVSLLLSQLSENKRLERVFKDLFSAEGSEIYLKPVSDYIKTGIPVNFHTLIDAAAAKGETAIGYRIATQSNEAAQAYGVKVNPNKEQEITYTDADKVIVLAEN
ncbi:MAG: potassium transporter TrkA [Bacteroidia bacterium]|nr:potassium transporter TrkA [Bacteroidia bacterium]